MAVLSLKPCVQPSLWQNYFFTSWSPPSRVTASPSDCTETGSSAQSFCSCAEVMEKRRMLCSLDCRGRENLGAHPPQCKLQPLGDAVVSTLLSASVAALSWPHAGISGLQSCKYHLCGLSELTFCMCRAKPCFAEHRFCSGPQEGSL